MAILRWPPFAKFCKDKFRLFLSLKQGKRNGHGGQFAMATICEFLQKLILTFFKALSKAKESAVS